MIIKNEIFKKEEEKAIQENNMEYLYKLLLTVVKSKLI